MRNTSQKHYRMNRGAVQAVILLMLFACPWPLSAAAGQDGGKLAREVCGGCHGPSGVSQNPLVPTLAGQPYSLIEDNLLAYRQGGRACSARRNDGSPGTMLAQTMCQVVAGLSDAEIESLASFYESRQFVTAEQDFDPQSVPRGSRVHQEYGCEHCHSGGGAITNNMAPRLAGQWTPYLRRAMSALRSGEKQGPEVMNDAIHAMEAAEVEALLQFYASQQ